MLHPFVFSWGQLINSTADTTMVGFIVAKCFDANGSSDYHSLTLKKRYK
jgi:hypothetical protein